MFHEFSWVFSLNTIGLVSTYFLVLQIRTFFMTFYSHRHTFIKRFKVWCVVISGNENQIINKDMWAQPTNVDDGYTYICGRGSTSTLIRECSQQLFDNENKSQLVCSRSEKHHNVSDRLPGWIRWTPKLHCLGRDCLCRVHWGSFCWGTVEQGSHQYNHFFTHETCFTRNKYIQFHLFWLRVWEFD